MLEEIIRYNKRFVASKSYEQYRTSKYPDKKIAIITCMDTRLTELLPAALGFKNGDVKIIKNAGGMISHPFGSAMRSILVAIYELGVQEIMVIGHTDCGVQHMDSRAMVSHMQDRGVSQEHIDMIRFCGVDLDGWLSGFDDVENSVKESVEIIRNHPLMPPDVSVKGFIMDSVTGELIILE